MKRILIAVASLLVVLAAEAGMVVTVENDVFNESDDNYTHGTQLMWVEPRVRTNASDWSAACYGLRSRIYTPDDKTRTEPPYEWERPYCGVTTAFMEWWRKERLFGALESVRYGAEIGVLGPCSKAKEMQTEFHRITGNTLPKGWDNQMPNELALNAYMDRYRRLFFAGKRGGFGMDADFVYGGTVGTTFIEAKSAVDVSLGWNMPENYVSDVIAPKAFLGWGWYSGLVGEVSGWWQLHNATIGDSFFVNDAERKAKERTLENWVGEIQGGAVVGCRWFSVKYLRAWRSDEFEGQAKVMDWGSLTVTFGRTF